MGLFSLVHLEVVIPLGSRSLGSSRSSRPLFRWVSNRILACFLWLNGLHLQRAVQEGGVESSELVEEELSVFEEMLA